MNAIVSTPVSSLPTQSTQIPGPKIILMGDSGTGKSTSIVTLCAEGITPFVIATEQNFMQATKEFLGTKMHYKFISPKPKHGLDSVTDMIKKINVLSYENLCKTVDPFRQAHDKFLEILATCNDFKCDCCGKSWGSVESWGTDRALVLDGLSGISDMAFGLVVGNKPVKALPDYGVAQNAIKMFLDTATTQFLCPVVLIAHMDKEKDEITGAYVVTLRTVGNKLGPDLPRMFSDVIRARREGDRFTWDTADSQSTVVARHLPIASNLPPSFTQIISAWKAKGGQITQSKT